MAHLKEPAGVDLLVAPTPLTDQDRQLISAAIATYKSARKPLAKPRKPRSATKITAD